MSSTTPEKTIELNLTLEVRQETHIAVKLFCRLVERITKAKSEREQLAAIRKFAEDLEEAKQAQARLDHLAESEPCDCPACAFKRELRDAIAPRTEDSKSLIAWASLLVEFVKKGKGNEAKRANEMFGNSTLTVADYFAAGVSEENCLLLLGVVPRGSFGNKPEADKVDAAAAPAPAAAQEEAPPATA